MRARLHLELTDRHGRTLARRRRHNAVMRSGAQLVADLFAGSGAPITHMGVGTSDAAPDDVTVTALSNEPVGDDGALEGGTTTPIAAEAFTSSLDEARRIVQVRVRATLPAAAAVGRIREAGLVSQPVAEAAVLYNRVTFAPVTKGDDHELTLFWEVEFPFGDLQWLS